MFVALTMEGFTEKQALIIVGQILAAAFGAQEGKSTEPRLRSRPTL